MYMICLVSMIITSSYITYCTYIKRSALFLHPKAAFIENDWDEYILLIGMKHIIIYGLYIVLLLRLCSPNKKSIYFLSKF